MKNKVLFVLPIVVLLVTCNTNNNGSAEPSSNQATFLHGRGAPSNSIGENFFHYYDEATRFIWEKNDGKWYNRFVKASDAIIGRSRNNNNRHRKLSLLNDKELLINALAESFYTTNGTATVSTNYPGSEYVWAFTCAFSKESVVILPDWSVDPEGNTTEYYKVNEEGKLYQYVDGSYVEVDNDNVYCVVPHPAVETFLYDNFLMYDDDFGHLTGIIAANIDRFSYDDETNLYSAEDIEISHGPITSYYVHESKSDEIKVNYSFELSEDSSYVKKASFVITDAQEMAGFVGMNVVFEFSNLHNTIVDIPE